MASLGVVLDTELRRVLPRLAHRHGLSPAEQDELVDALYFTAHIVEPVDAPQGADELRDLADRPVLGTLARALSEGRAEALVTGDGDLLALQASWPILTPAAFWAAHGGP